MKRTIFLLAIIMAAFLATNAQTSEIKRKPKQSTATATTKPKQATTSASKPKPAVSQKQSTASKQKPKSGGVSNAPTLGTSNYTPEVKTYYANGVAFQMVEVRGGTFRMGATSEQGSDAYDDEEKPTLQVTLSSYSIGKTEVTQALWKAVMGSKASFNTGDNLPVGFVSWDDCQEFIRKLNALTGETFRLPTEAEWEYAARGGSKSRGYKYSGSNTVGDVAWYDGNSGSKTHPVGTKAPNELGIYDMTGNVREWCSDRYGDYSSASQTNPKGPNSGSYRVFRGGSWYDDARGCRVSFRFSNYPSIRNSSLGLRLAR